jgi:hypothetical protein
MSHCSSLGEATAAVAEVENVEEVTVLVELERVFRENMSPPMVRGMLRARTLRTI